MKHTAICALALALTVQTEMAFSTEKFNFTVPGLSSPMLNANWKGQCIDGKADGLGVATWALQDGKTKNLYKVWTRAKKGVVWGDGAYDMFSMNGEAPFPNFMPPGEMAVALREDECRSNPECAEVMSFYEANRNSNTNISKSQKPGKYTLYALIIDSHTGKRGVLSIASSTEQALQYSKSSMPAGTVPSGPPIKCGPGWIGMIASQARGTGSGIGITCGRATAEEATRDALQECRKIYPTCGTNSDHTYEVSWGRVTNDITPGENLSFDTFTREGAFCHFANGYPFGECQNNPRLLNVVRGAGVFVDARN